MAVFVVLCTSLDQPPPSLICECLALSDDNVRHCFAECTMVDTSDTAW